MWPEINETRTKVLGQRPPLRRTRAMEAYKGEEASSLEIETSVSCLFSRSCSRARERRTRGIRRKDSLLRSLHESRSDGKIHHKLAEHGTDNCDNRSFLLERRLDLSRSRERERKAKLTSNPHSKPITSTSRGCPTIGGIAQIICMSTDQLWTFAFF